MSENKKSTFVFNINSTNDLTEEIYVFSNNNNKKNTVIFISIVITISLIIAYLAFQFGALLNVDTDAMNEIYLELKDTDINYSREFATHETLLSEKEELTQNLLTKQSETGQLNDYSLNRDNLKKKLEDVKAEHEKLKISIENRKKQIEESGESIYSITLNPGIYIVGKNIPSAIFAVSGNGSILASTSSGEVKINEKLSKDTPIDLQFSDGYTIKITSITKFVLKG